MSKNRVTFDNELVLRDAKVGIGTSVPTSSLNVVGDVDVKGPLKITSVGSTTAEEIQIKHYRDNGGSTVYEIEDRHLFSIDNSQDGIAYSINDTDALPALTVSDAGITTIRDLYPTTTTYTSVGSTAFENIQVKHYRNIAYQPAIDNRGAISFDSPSGISTDGISLFPASLFALTNDPTGNIFSVAGYGGYWSGSSGGPAIDVTQFGRIGIGTTTPITDFHINRQSYFTQNIGINTTTPVAPLDVRGDLLITGSNASLLEMITIKPQTAGINTLGPSRGSIFYEGIIDSSGNGGQLLTILNDNNSLLTINRQLEITSANPPPVGTRFIEPVLEITNSGNIGIGTTLPIHRFEINSRNQFVSSVVAIASSIGISTTLITGINTTGIAVGLEIQGFTGVIATGTTVTSIGSSQIGIGRTTLNNFDRINTLLTFGNRVNDRVVGVTSLGFVGIRTTTPVQPLQVGSGSSVVVIDTMGEIGIGTTTPRVALDVIGNANISGVTTVGLASTSSPTVVSTMSFELTDNNTLTVRVRGNDNVVRTGIITLT